MTPKTLTIFSVIWTTLAVAIGIGVWKISQNQNLSASQVAAEVPTGTISAFIGSTPPDGWLLCDGQTDLTKDPKYKNLADMLAPGDWETSMKVPDLRGMFLRGANGANRTDGEFRIAPTSSTRVGKFQSQSIGPHEHSLQKVQAQGGGHARVTDIVATGEGNIGDNAKVLWAWELPMAQKTDETRPQNVAVNWIIKY